MNRRLPHLGCIDDDGRSALPEQQENEESVMGWPRRGRFVAVTVSLPKKKPRTTGLRAGPDTLATKHN
jgi:hypothetical protein